MLCQENKRVEEIRQAIRNWIIAVFYHDHRRWLRQWLRARLGYVWDAANLTHDTCVKILHADPVHLSTIHGAI
jgi:DNA-directed RNA polymerase specialized sigma24 family protein